MRIRFLLIVCLILVLIGYHATRAEAKTDGITTGPSLELIASAPVGYAIQQVSEVSTQPGGPQFRPGNSAATSPLTRGWPLIAFCTGLVLGVWFHRRSL